MFLNIIKFTFLQLKDNLEIQNFFQRTLENLNLKGFRNNLK